MELPFSSDAPPLLVVDYVGPVCGAALFVLLMHFIREPSRHTFNVVFVAGVSSAYLSGGFGVWELIYPALVMPVLYRAVTSPGFIGGAWLMHAAWDLAHHFWGRPIWPFMPASAFGCFLFDTLIAVWFLAGTPTLVTTRVGLKTKG
jgi:hypothetical protein